MVMAPIPVMAPEVVMSQSEESMATVEEPLPMVVVPSVKALHRSRGSVKGKSPWRSEYWRGYHHAQSKLIFAAKHFGPEVAHRLRSQLVWQTLLTLPLRVLLFSPKLIARMWGRLMGVLA